MSTYYNEHDPKAVSWLRELIKQGHVAPGEVDERSILDVKPSDLRGYTQCHFFAGIGVWSYALRAAGWSDDRPVWTGSCPCQPFSAAGKGGGFDDERHLWPAFHHLIRECRPRTIFGEQVASKDGLGWLDLVQADLEGEAYACAAVDFCAASVGAPHIRQRLYWVAVSTGFGCERRQGTEGRSLGRWPTPGRTEGLDGFERGDQAHVGSLADSDHHGLQGAESPFSTDGGRRSPDKGCEGLGRLADPENERCREGGADLGGFALGDRPEGIAAGSLSGGADHGLADDDDQVQSQGRIQGPGEGLRAGDGSSCERPAGLRSNDGMADDGRPCPTNGFWRDPDWLFCRDGKWRPVEPGTSPLVDGAPARVGRLRGYGNALCAPQAIAFIRSYLDIEVGR